MSRYKFPETHGMWNSHRAEYRCWQDMIQRCHNPSSRWFGSYGNRGIFVCDRWKESFENFIADMGKRPYGTSLDRIDNDGSYTPENCRWATIQQQNRNHRGCLFIEHNGERKTLIEWSEETGVNPKTIRSRYLKGYQPEMLFSKKKFSKHTAKLKEKNS